MPPVTTLIGDRLLGFGARQAREARARVVDVAQHAGRGGDEEEALGFERGRELVADHVGVDVVDVALGVGTEAREHGRVAAAPQGVEELRC